MDSALHRERRRSRSRAGLLRSNLHSRSPVGELVAAEPPGGNSIRAILLDIEGTTTPVNFVYRTLFPYARARLGQFLLEHRDDPAVRRDIEALHLQNRTADLSGQPQWMDQTPEFDLASATQFGLWLMDRDSKCTALKSLQGKIWHDGYQLGELHGEVYPDVPPAMVRWSRQGKTICIFSSGSVLAQKLLFGSTNFGDLTGHIQPTSIPRPVPRTRRLAIHGLRRRWLLSHRISCLFRMLRKSWMQPMTLEYKQRSASGRN